MSGKRTISKKWQDLARLLVFGHPERGHLTPDEIADEVGYSREHVTRLLRDPAYETFRELVASMADERDWRIRQVAGNQLLDKLRGQTKNHLRELVAIWDKAPAKLPVRLAEEEAPVSEGVDLSRLSTEELKALDELLAKAEAEPEAGADTDRAARGVGEEESG